MSETETLLRELVAAQTARADVAERALAAALAQIEALRADAEHAREVRRRDADRKARVRGLSTENPRNVPGHSTDIPRTPPSPSSPPAPSPSSPHTPYITPSSPPSSPPPQEPAAAAPPARPPKKRGSGAKYPAFSEADCDALWVQWGNTFGAVEYSAFRKALGPHYQAATCPPSVAEMSAAMTAFREAVDEMDEREAGFQTIHKFAQRLPHWLTIGAMPYSTEWGELTERGRVLGSRAVREQQRAGMRQSA